MEFKNFWIWDEDKRVCINSRSIRYFDIETLADPVGVGADMFVVYAQIKEKAIVISRHDTKQKAIDRIDNIFMMVGRCF